MSRLALCEISGPLTDLIQKLSGESGNLWAEHLKKMLREGVRRWREEDGVIYFEVTSNGRTGLEWIEYLETPVFQVDKWAKDVLMSPDFKPTNGVIYRIAVIKGTLFSASDRITKKIRAEAKSRKLEKPNAEVVCLIRDAFSNEELKAMGLWEIVVFHDSIRDSAGGPRLLAVFRGFGGRWLHAYCDRPDVFWFSGCGFAFAVSQVSSN